MIKRRVLAVGLFLLAVGACAVAEHKHHYKFTYLSEQRALFQCYNGQKPSVDYMEHMAVLSCDGE